MLLASDRPPISFALDLTNGGAMGTPVAAALGGQRKVLSDINTSEVQGM